MLPTLLYAPNLIPVVKSTCLVPLLAQTLLDINIPFPAQHSAQGEKKQRDIKPNSSRYMDFKPFLGYNRRTGEASMEDRTEATEMKRAGMSIDEIAAELSVEPATVYDWLLSQDAIKQAREHRNDRIVEAYQAGQTIATICATFDVTQGTVYRVLHQRNVPLRRDREPLSRQERAEIIRMYEAGHLVSVIRRETRRSLSTIYNVLDQADIPRRRGLRLESLIAIPIIPD